MAGKQFIMTPTFSENIDSPMSVPERLVQKYLDKGWVLAEGQKFKAPKEKVKGGRVLEVNESLVPGGENPYTKPLRPGTVDTRQYAVDENEDEDNIDEQGTGVVTGKELGANDAIRTPIVQDDRRKVAPNTPTSRSADVPGSLSGIDKDKLLAIAKAEGVDVDSEAAKPVIKAAIEAKRNSTPVDESN